MVNVPERLRTVADETVFETLRTMPGCVASLEERPTTRLKAGFERRVAPVAPDPGCLLD